MENASEYYQGTNLYKAIGLAELKGYRLGVILIDKAEELGLWGAWWMNPESRRFHSGLQKLGKRMMQAYVQDSLERYLSMSI